MSTTAIVKSRLSGAFPDAAVEVVDLTGTEDHLQVTITSRSFVGKSRIDQHKMVYAALGELMSGPIHALALTTRTQ
jgi:stress-induced morphogen